MLTLGMKILAVSGSIVLFILVFELVRSRKLDIRLSWLWLLLVLNTVVLIFIPGVLKLLTTIIGARDMSSIIFFIGLGFLGVLCIELSVKVSQTFEKIKVLTQRIAILEHDVLQLHKQENDTRT